MAPSLASVGNSAHSPFNHSASKPGPKPGGRNRPRIDISTLKVKKNVPLPVGRNIVGKYNSYFDKLVAKDAIECKPDEVSAVANALRKYLRESGKDKTLTIISQKNCDDDLSIGRVWLWPLEDADEARLSRGGQTKAARAKSGSKAK